MNGDRNLHVQTQTVPGPGGVPDVQASVLFDVPKSCQFSVPRTAMLSAQRRVEIRLPALENTRAFRFRLWLARRIVRFLGGI